MSHPIYDSYMFSAFEEILDGEEEGFDHVFEFYDKVMQGDSTYSECESPMTHYHKL